MKLTWFESLQFVEGDDDVRGRSRVAISVSIYSADSEAVFGVRRQVAHQIRRMLHVKYMTDGCNYGVKYMTHLL